MVTRFDDKELRPLIEGCLRKELDSQQKLYKRLYGFAMSKCLRYASNKYDAAEILNDGFLKVFKNISKYDYKWPFHAWVGKIMSNTAIDRYRSELKHSHTKELVIAEDIGQEATIYQALNYQDMLKMIQELPASYRTAFNLFAIDGYTHEEISQMLGISVGASKSNLFKARQKLQKALQKSNMQDVQSSAEEGKIIPIKKFSVVNISINGGLEL
ncbi:MAG TPA: sigma-70 family RNA polymerase sigma factor [Sphingobacteriaceae bacterium]|nr:sigma-70 family RNA polymerase sigma factor [Sphingobacteriaceae bacterium]